MSTPPQAIDPYDVTQRSHGLRRRRLTEKAFSGLAIAAALAAVAVLGLVLYTVVSKGLSELSPDLFTEPRPLFGETGGIADALIGSALIVGIATLIAKPVAIHLAIDI